MASIPNDENAEARVVPLADGRGLARCAACGAPLAPVLDFAIRLSIDPWGFTLDGDVFRPTTHYLAQRRRVEGCIGAGRAAPADGARLRRGAFGRPGDPTRQYDPIKHLPRRDDWTPDMPPDFLDRFSLPARVACPQCDRVNRISRSGA